jgi:uncharacterized protein YdaU (DUF1376 family)
LDAYYSAEKPLPKDREILYTMVRANTKKDQLAVDFVLSQFFLETRYGFTNRRAKKEFLRTNEIRLKRVKAGKQRAKKSAHAQHVHSNPDSRLQTPDKDLKEREEKTNTAAAPLISPVPPSSLPLPVWLAFAEMRRKLRKPLTNHASELIWRELEKLRAQGHDPVECLEASIRNGWLDVYPPKETKNGQHESFHEKRSRQSAAAIDKVLGRFEEASGDIQRTLPPARE